MSNTQLPLHALRAFVAVVRCGGVSRAAEALHLTHSAVSHQLRALQETLGVSLFDKQGRGLEPTHAAREFAQRVEGAFDEIALAAQTLSSGSRKRLRVGTIPSLAACWLLPRLGDFIACHPGLDVEVASSEHLADIKGGELDVALRFGAGQYPGLHSELLMRDWLFPVCSPDFARQNALGDPARIAEYPLLHSSCEPWSDWFAAAGVVAAEPTHGVVFNDSALLLQAAMAGQGVGLARHSIAHDALCAGRLVRPYAAMAVSQFSYYLVCRKEKFDAAPISQFRQWVSAQAVAMSAP